MSIWFTPEDFVCLDQYGEGALSCGQLSYVIIGQDELLPIYVSKYSIFFIPNLFGSFSYLCLAHMFLSAVICHLGGHYVRSSPVRTQNMIAALLASVCFYTSDNSHSLLVHYDGIKCAIWPERRRREYTARLDGISSKRARRSIHGATHP